VAATAALENNQTALHFAAWHGNAAMVTALLKHRATVNVFEAEHGGSPLAWTLHGSLNSWEREKGDYRLWRVCCWPRAPRSPSPRTAAGH